MSAIAVILADDHPIVRGGIKSLIESRGEFRVIGEAGSGLEAVELAEKLKPDVLVVDLRMPGLGGLEVVRQVHQRAPMVRSMVLSMSADESSVLTALRNGASGYVLKDSDPEIIEEGIRTVASGSRYLCPRLAKQAVESYIEKALDADKDIYDTLTTREREILHMAAEGRSNPEIAAVLSISPRTVEVHRARVFKKLGLHGQSDLVRFAIRRGILPQDQ